jgi:hypothetical protein
MERIDEVTQRTVSASHELASTAEELAAQAAGLTQLVQYFRAQEGGRAPLPAPPETRALARA